MTLWVRMMCDVEDRTFFNLTRTGIVERIVGRPLTSPVSSSGMALLTAAAKRLFSDHDSWERGCTQLRIFVERLKS